MKMFLLGFFSALIIGGWVALAIVGVIPLKVAIAAPLCLAAGFGAGYIICALIFASFWKF